MALTEFEIIRRFFSDIQSDHADSITLGIGDDCAIIHIPETQELVLSIDTQLEGVHFPFAANAEQIAQRAFRCAVSDLAAMGATPLCFTLALTLPAADESWLQSFSAGLKKVAKEFSCSLVGGDTTKGPLSITLQVQGTVPKGKALKRSQAKVNDVILVSGYLGNSAAYVELMKEGKLGQKEFVHAQELFMQDFFYPQARVTLGKALLNSSGSAYAHSAIDISDGLLADLGHICRASKVHAEIQVDQLPLIPELKTGFGKDNALQLALTGGDDYQLCFTASETKVRKIISLSEDMECPVTVVGRITERVDNTEVITCYHSDGRLFDASKFSSQGYSHF